MRGILKQLVLAVKESPLSSIGFFICLSLFIVGMHSDYQYGMQISFIGAVGSFLIPFYVSRKPASINEA